MLKREGHEVRLVFLTGEGSLPESVLVDLEDVTDGADLIGVSLMTLHFHRAVQVTERLKGSCPIIWGGIHPTVRPEECLEYADIVCIGEGEGDAGRAGRAHQLRRGLRGCGRAVVPGISAGENTGTG